MERLDRLMFQATGRIKVATYAIASAIRGAICAMPGATGIPWWSRHRCHDIFAGAYRPLQGV